MWKNKTGKFSGMAVLIIVVVAVLLVMGSIWVGMNLSSKKLLDQIPNINVNVPAQNTGAGTGLVASGTSGASTGGPNYQPTAAYVTKDKWASTVVTGTAYYKAGQMPATTTAKTNVNVGEVITYWVDNSTYYVKPVTQSTVSGVNDFVADSWQNGSVSLTLYDLVAKAGVTSGTSANATLGANGIANIEVTYLGTAKKSAMPFGGIMVVEYNSTIGSMTCTGDDIQADTGKFQLTYGASSSTLVFKKFEVKDSLDVGAASTGKKIVCQFQNGATSLSANGVYYIKFYPANYYVTNGGDILLDTEKAKNDVTTRTGLAGQVPSVTGYWG